MPSRCQYITYVKRSFPDEPTSGLDSQSAWAIVTFLREFADNEKAILYS